MKLLLKAVSYIFHPIWMPLLGTLLYFVLTPRFFPSGVVRSKIMAVAIMSLFIPIVFHFLLRTLGKAQSYFLEDVRERKWPLLFFSAVNLIVLEFVLNAFDFPEIYYFFLAILFSSILALLFALFRLKISLHMVGLSGLTTFLIVLSMYYSLNLIYTISFFIGATGLTASSRLQYQAHTYRELVLGLLVGAVPQLLMYLYWL